MSRWEIELRDNFHELWTMSSKQGIFQYLVILSLTQSNCFSHQLLCGKIILFLFRNGFHCWSARFLRKVVGVARPQSRSSAPHGQLLAHHCNIFDLCVSRESVGPTAHGRKRSLWNEVPRRIAFLQKVEKVLVSKLFRSFLVVYNACQIALSAWLFYRVSIHSADIMMNF